MQNIPQPNQQQPAPATAAPPAAGTAPANGTPPTAQSNPALGFNQTVYNILVQRIQSFTPQDMAIAQRIVIPANRDLWVKLLPELVPMFNAVQAQKQQPGPIGQSGQPPAGQGAPPPAGGGSPPPAQAGGPSAAQPGGAPGQGSGDDEDEESDNPLVQNPASNGLIG